MKKETIGILFVCLILIVGGMFALWITTAPANGGDADDPETRDDWTTLVPITENATVTITVNHSGNATVMQTYNPPYSRYMSFDHAILIDKDDLLNNYERVYLYVMLYKEYPTTIEENQTTRTWVTVTYAIMLFTSDGIFTIAHQNQNLIIDMTTNDSDVHATVDFHDADQTTYTFHYPKIIGWQEP